MTEPVIDEARPGKARSRAMINPSAIEMIPRHAGRIGRLKQAIEEYTAEGDTEKAEELQAELDRRVADLTTAKGELDNL